MRILLVQGSVYVPTHGGANKSNRTLLEALAKRGHECQAMSVCCGVHASASRAMFREELRGRGIAVKTDSPLYDVFELDGVRILAATDLRAVAESIGETVLAFDPDWILVASEDVGQLLLEAALRADSKRVIYVGRTTFLLPFGPEAALKSPRSLQLLKNTAGIVVVSEYLKEYVRTWSGLKAVVLPLCLNGEGPFPHLGHFDRGYVTMVNPCEYKGIAIFERLAREFPEVLFAAVPSWGTTENNMKTLTSFPNIRILQPADDIANIFSQTRIVLVPSLCSEAKSNLITEAMLYGIPVLASHVGGNSEALMGLDYLLPVRPLTRYSCKLDGKMLPIADTPRQELGPWSDALRTLLGKRFTYERLSSEARRVALIANKANTTIPLEEYLTDLKSATHVGLDGGGVIGLSDKRP